MRTFKSRKTLIAIVAGLIAFSLSGCDLTTAKFDIIADVSFTEDPIELVLEDNKTPEIVITAKDGSPLNTQFYDFIYESDEENVVTYVDGILTPIAVGNTIISARVEAPEDYGRENTLMATAAVKVISVEDAIPLQSVSFNTTSYTVQTGKLIKLEYTKNPNNAYVKSTAFISQDINIATVTQSGMIQGIKKGATAIDLTLTSADGTQKFASVNIEVTEPDLPPPAPEPTGIKITPEGHSTIKVGGTAALSYSVLPSNAVLVDTVTWTSSDSSKASVSTNGVVTGVAEGGATITAKSGTFTSTKTFTVESNGGGGGSDEFNGYYASVPKGAKGAALRSALKSIITSGGLSKSYDWSRYEDADESETDKNAILCIYARLNYPKNDHVRSGNIGWNREHSYPQSKLSGDADKDNHHIFASDAKLNGTRSNDKFGMVSGSTYCVDSYNRKSGCKSSGSVFEPVDAAKGEVARATFYMVTFYNLTIGNNFQSEATAFDWNTNFGVSSRERIRNNIVQRNQRNRNPYIDHPEWARMAWDSSYTGPGAWE